MKLILFFAFVVVFQFCNGQGIVTIETKTMDTGGGSGMNTGKVDIEIHNINDEYCAILDLNGEGNDFKPGAIDEFVGAELQDCLLFVVPQHNVTKVRLQHHGADAWTCEWMRIIFDDNFEVQCYDGKPLDNGDFQYINCE